MSFEDIPFNRYQTYRHPGDARRSFYRFVCKHELYGNLIKAGEFKGRPYYIRDREKYNYGGIGFRRGYPSFEAPRSEARNQWEREFEVHRQRMDDEWRKEFWDRIHGRERLAEVERMKHSKFFKLSAAGAALKQAK